MRRSISPALSLFFFTGAALFSVPAAHAVNWTYDGVAGSEEEWSNIDKKNAACENGKEQSPVQIGYTKNESLPPLVFHYGEAKAHLQQKEYTLVADVQNDVTMTDKDKTYRLVEIRFHTPSEHEVLGRFWPLEIQMMHRNNDGKMLIVSVFANKGASNPALQPLLLHANDNTWLTDIAFNPQGFIPQKTGYYAYTGSLTIPPCTEGVEWRIFKEPITVSHNQIIDLEKITHRNARLLQPIYMRSILETD
jgi:carbonic anhydrase